MMKLQSKYIVLTLSVLTVFIFSCMEPILDTDEKNLDYQIQNHKDGYLNLDFEDGTDFWEFNSSRIYSNQPNSISIEKTNEIAESGSNCLAIKLKNQRLDVTRTIEYSPGDSLNFSMKFYIDVDSISYLNVFEIRIAFLDKNFNRLGYEYDFINDINTKVWEKREISAK